MHANSCPWWASEEDCGAEGAGPLLWEHCRAVEDKQFSHHQRLLFNALQYSNREVTAFDWGWGKMNHTSLLPYRDGTENLVQSVVESLVAAVGKNKVKARPKTKRASFKLRRSSRKLDRYLYAEAKRLEFWERHKQAFEDACWGEVGCLYWGWNDEGPFVERVFPDELVVDNDECHAEPKPLQVTRRRPVHVESAIAQWGLDKDVADQLREEAKQGTESWVQDRAPGPGWVVVVEAHRLPCGSAKGRHVVGTKNLTLVDEAWDENWFPYSFFHYARPVSGFYCRSAVEMAWPYQRRLDEINAVIRDGQDLACRMRIWAPIGAKLDIKELTNRVGKVIHSAIKPEVLTWPAAPPELYNERDRVVKSCFEYFGLTQLSAQGKLPQGARLDSSKAMSEYNAIQDDRLVDIAQRYESFQLEGYNKIVQVSELAHKQGKSFKSTWVAGRRVEEVNWDDIDYSRDRYVLTVEPSSTMNESMAAHFDDAAKMVQSGVITPEEYLSLQSTPDTERLISLRLSGIENIFMTIERIEEGQYTPPSPMQDLVSGVQMVHFHHLDLLNEYEDVPMAVLNNLTLWIMQAKWTMEMGSDFSAQGSEVASQGAPMDPMQAQTAPMPAGVPMDPSQLPGLPGLPGISMPTTPSMTPNAAQLR